MPHRLELAVMSMLKNCREASVVMDILHLIYKTYHYSPKSKRELKSIGEELGVSVNNPTRVMGTRWSPHIQKALNVLLKTPSDPSQPGQFAIVLTHLEHVASTSTSSDIKGRAKHVSQKLKDFQFLAYCHFILDLLYYIASLSLTLQSNKTILATAVSDIKACIDGVTALSVRTKNGSHLQKFLNLMYNQIQTGAAVKFQTVEQSRSFQNMAINANEGVSFDELSLTFRQSMANSVDMVVSGMRNGYESPLADSQDDIPDGPSKAVNSFLIFNHDKWPEDTLELMDYGEGKIKFLIEWFRAVLQRNGCTCENILLQWKQLKTLVRNEFQDKSFTGLWEILLTKDPYKEKFEDILHLVRILLVLPITSAQCERTISAVNRIKSDIRNCLEPSTVKSLIRISSEGPSLEDFQSKNCVKRWFSTPRKASCRGWPVQ